MAYIDWIDNNKLKDDLQKYVKQNVQRHEILDFIKNDYSEYKWSLRTLDRRLRQFDIYYIDTSVTVEDARNAVQKELDGPGSLLGYRAMHLKLRQKYELKVPRHMVHNIMYELAPDQLEQRTPGQKAKKKREHFTSKGSNWVFSLDGHDKLMRYQNWTFPIAIYGCIDTSSRKIMWLKVWTTNSKPEIIGRWYLTYLFESRKLPAYLRIDKGTETGILTTMHAYLRQNHGELENPTDAIIFGPSTSNQVYFCNKLFRSLCL